MLSLRRLQKAAEPITRQRRLPLCTFSLTAARRAYSTASEQRIGSRLSPLFTALLAVGAASTAYGLWELYDAMTIWPPEVRQDLREALKAKNSNDLGLSEQFFLRAWNTVKMLPLDALGDEPYLKISGVAVAFADVLEQDSKLFAAAEVYTEALKMIQDAMPSGSLTPNERLRGVAIALKAGDLDETLKRAQDEEKALSWAVEEVLRLVKEANEGVIDPKKDSSSETLGVLAELELPPWVSSTDVGAPLEALAGFYKRVGKIDYALPLYLQAISILIPPPPQTSPPEDQCRGAQLMGNLSELILRRGNKLTPEALHQAESWAKKALVVLQKTRKQHEMIPICEFAYAAALFNVGLMRELAGDKSMAGKFYKKGLDHSAAIGMQEGVNAANESLKRVGVAVEGEPVV